MKLSPIQVRLREGIVALLREAGVEPVVREKTVRAEPPGGEELAGGEEPAGGKEPPGPDAVAHEVLVRWDIGDARFEAWLYADGAGIEEPGGDWWPFDGPDFADEAELAEAVLDHVRDILAEAGEP